MMKPTLTNPAATISRLLDVAWSQNDRAQLLRQQLQAGQQLSAKVLELPRPGLAKLELLTTEILARTALPLRPGQTLRLEVVKQGPVPELRLLQPQIKESPSQQVLRQALPRQIPLQEGLRELAQVLGDKQSRHLPGETRHLLRQILDRPLTPQRLNSSNLQQTFQSSGLFTEALLAQARPVASNDHKLLLWKLLNSLFQARDSQTATSQAKDSSSQLRQPLQTAAGAGQVSEAAKAVSADQAKAEAQRLPDQTLINRLTRLVEGSVARIHTQQAVSLPQDDGGQRQVWQLELPIALKDDQARALQLQIEQDPDPTRQEGHRWRVQLDFDFGILGDLRAGVLLEGETVSTTFWCELEKTEQKIDLRLPELAAAFQKAGLTVGQLQAHHGLPDRAPLPRRPESLLDERV